VPLRAILGVSTGNVERAHQAFDALNRRDLDWLISHCELPSPDRKATLPLRTYYVGPGHTPVLFAGTEVEFSPTEELGRTMEVVTKNMEEMQASA
jgi:hypothetical protein